jgi:hypothetical protein
VSGDPNQEISLVGGGRLTVNEQLPSAGTDADLKANGNHLVLPVGWGGPQEYTDAFLRSARRAVEDLCERRGSELESLTCEVVPGDTDAVVAATTVVLFRGRRCVFRRGIWPPSHPADTRAAIYASVLEERLLTREIPQLGDVTSPVDL